MNKKVPTLTVLREVFIENKSAILQQWVQYNAPKEILQLHGIDETFFLEKYASGVFDYFMGVISGDVEIGNCPVMQELLTYLKKREISADELFDICTHFKRAMVDFSYDKQLNSKELFDEISYIFDANFKGILKFYTDTIFQKLIDARQDAIRASQAREYFLSNMSHEIRTPLNAILGFVNLLLDDEISKKHRNYLDIIHNSGENLLSIINDILDFSKLRSGEFTLELKIFSLHDELSHTMELFVASANAKDITITSFINPNIPIELYGDSLRIKQILSNFLSNAIKFTPESGIIKIDAAYRDKTLIVSVEDNGIGIDEKDITRIFSAFAQAQESYHANEGGTGLGLSISSQLAQKMGGEVSVSSTVGKGSIFTMSIPIETMTLESQMFDDIQEFRKLKMLMYAKDLEISFKHESFLRYAEIFEMDIKVVDKFSGEYDIGLFIHEDIDNTMRDFILSSEKKYIALMSREYDTYENYSHINPICFPLYCSKIHAVFSELLNPSQYAEHASNISQKYKGHILVAEDNEANQELIKIVLSKYGLTFDLAHNGEEAVALYKEHSYDLILMDEQMPIMNGNEAVGLIIEYEESEGVSHTPISALTANVIKGAKERDLLNGFDAFLGKPLVLKELERVFASYLKADNSVASLELKEEQESVVEDVNSSVKIVGLDVEKLTEALMLEPDELLMLLELFLNKMQKTIPKLEEAISQRDFKEIALIAHSIKGSSGNFRMKELQELANAMEEMAKLKSSSYEYEKSFESIVRKLDKIKIL